MKKIICLVFCLCFSIVFGKEKSIEELERENKLLELQIKNEKMKKELEAIKNGTISYVDNQDNSKVKITKDQKRSGILWGIGIGGMTGTYLSQYEFCYSGLYGYCSTQDTWGTGTGFLLDSQFGGMTMWNRYFGVQYYANVDFGMSPDFFSFILTFNTDAILNAYNSDNFGFGFLLGLGTGIRTDIATMFGIEFDTRFNAGIRFIFGSKYALDFMIRTPFTRTYSFVEAASYSLRFTLGQF